MSRKKESPNWYLGARFRRKTEGDWTIPGGEQDAFKHYFKPDVKERDLAGYWLRSA